MGECRSYPKIASKMNILQRKVLRAGERCFCALHLLCASLFQAPLYLGLKSYLQITVSMILEVPTNIEYSFCQFAWWHNNSMLTLQGSKPACKTASLYYKEQSQEFLWLDLFRTTLFPWINHNSVCVCVCVCVCMYRMKWSESLVELYAPTLGLEIEPHPGFRTLSCATRWPCKII